MSEDKKQLILIECAFEPTEVEHFTESVEIVEGRKVNALLRVTGKMQHANMENANKRVYRSGRKFLEISQSNGG